MNKNVSFVTGGLIGLVLAGSPLIAPAFAEPPSDSGLLTIQAPAGFEEITEEVKLTAPDEPPGAALGSEVTVGDDIVVGGAHRHQSTQGSIYIYQRDPSGPKAFRFVEKIFASDGGASHRFGEFMAIDGDTLVVTAWGTDQAYIFERHAGGPDQWGEVKILVGDDTFPGDQFGSAVAIHGDTIVVTAQAESGPISRSGAAYVFERNEGGPGNWGQTAKLQASDADTDYFFGSEVDLDSDRLAVGAAAGPARQAYVFERSGPGASDWSEVAILQPSGSGADFGDAIALSGDTVVVGAKNEDNGQGNTAGAAYVYDRNQGGPGAWGEVKRLVIPEVDAGGQGEAFGSSLALNGERLVVGAVGGGGVLADTGVVWIFDRDAGGPDNWGEVAKLFAMEAIDNDALGVSVAFDGNTVVSGANGVAGQSLDEGAVYTFLLGPTLWASGLCPGSATIGLAGGTPEGLAGLAWSTAQGSFIVGQGDCIGLELGLDLPNPLRALPADADGEVYFPFTAPPQACGLELQAIDLTTCEASNVATVPGG